MPGDGLVSGHLRHHVNGTSLVVLGYMPTVVPRPRRAGQAPTILYARNYETMCRLYESKPENILLNLWAGNMSIRRQDALRIGLAGDSALGYHADMAFGIRCYMSGMKGPSIVPSTRSTHSTDRSPDLRPNGAAAETRGLGCRIYIRRWHCVWTLGAITVAFAAMSGLHGIPSNRQTEFWRGATYGRTCRQTPVLESRATGRTPGAPNRDTRRISSL